MATKYVLIIYLCALPIFVACSGSGALVQPDPTAPGSITGRVTNPLQGNNVRNLNIFTIPSTQTTTTDSIGSFRVADVPPGDYTLYGRLYDESAVSAANVHVSVRPGENTTANLIVSSTAFDVGAINGVVLDEYSQPVRGATLGIAPGELEYTSGSDGTFNIPDVTAGVYRITATRGNSSGDVQVDVRAGHLSSIEIKLLPIDTASSTLIGTARESSLPLEGVVVRIVSLGIVDTTDANGTYRISNIPEGNYYVRFQKAGYRMRNVPLKIRQPGKSRIDALMVKGADISEHGLELYARLNGNLDDSSPRARELTMLGGGYATDRYGNPTGALACNGSGGVEVVDTIGLNALPITLGAWLYVPRGPDMNQLILGKSDHPSGDGYYFYLKNGALGLMYTTVRFNFTATVEFAGFPRDSWFWVAFTLDNVGTGYGTINGLYEMSLSGSRFPNTPTDTPARFRIGSVQTSTAMPGFTGRIDHVVLYNRKLNIDELRDIMEQGD